MNRFVMGWLAHALDAAGFRTDTVDYRGTREGMEAHVRLLDEAVAATHADRIHLVGHSMGGKTAMLMACQHPERIQRLVVVDIAPKDYFWPAHREEFAALNELNLNNLVSRQDAEERFAARISSYGLRKFLSTNLEQDEAGTWRWVINLPVLTAALPVMEKNCLQPTDTYRGPTLFIAGANSLYLPPSDHELVLGHFPQARIAIIPEAGHNPHVEQRAEFVRQLLAV